MSGRKKNHESDGRRTGSSRAASKRGTAVMAISLLLIILVIVYVVFIRLNPPSLADFDTDAAGTVELVQVKEGSSVSELGPELVERGIVRTNGAYQRAANENSRATSIQPGIYRLTTHMSAADAVAALLDPAHKVDELVVAGGATLMDVSVVGGATRSGIYSSIEHVTCEQDHCVSASDLQNVAANVDPAELGVPSWALESVRARGADARRLEGLIMPGSYVLDPESDAQEILTDLLTRSAQTYDEMDIESNATAVGLTPYQLVTAASLVEREAPADDFSKVARVILNRLAEPMRLEFDSTVNYDLSEVEVATTDEDRARVTPWNTYMKDGLPDTPIATPSEAAITAMENPAEGNWKFFVTTDLDGTTVFSDTFEEHEAAIQSAIDAGVLDSQR